MALLFFFCVSFCDGIIRANAIEPRAITAAPDHRVRPTCYLLLTGNGATRESGQFGRGNGQCAQDVIELAVGC